MKKVGKTTRPFRYDLNQIPYDYTVEVRNQFKGLDLIDRVLDEVCNEAKWLSEEASQIAEKRRDVKDKAEKERCPI